MKQSEALKHFREEYAGVAHTPFDDDGDGVVKVQARDLRRLFEAPPDFDVNSGGAQVPAAHDGRDEESEPSPRPLNCSGEQHECKR